MEAARTLNARVRLRCLWAPSSRPTGWPGWATLFGMLSTGPPVPPRRELSSVPQGRRGIPGHGFGEIEDRCARPIDRQSGEIVDQPGSRTCRSGSPSLRDDRRTRGEQASRRRADAFNLLGRSPHVLAALLFLLGGPICTETARGHGVRPAREDKKPTPTWPALAWALRVVPVAWRRGCVCARAAALAAMSRSKGGNPPYRVGLSGRASPTVPS